MIGAMRSRVSFFMNTLRKLGFSSYNGGLRVRRSLLTSVSHDSLRIFSTRLRHASVRRSGPSVFPN